jgi:hypothetical protein
MKATVAIALAAAAMACVDFGLLEPTAHEPEMRVYVNSSPYAAGYQYIVQVMVDPGTPLTPDSHPDGPTILVEGDSLTPDIVSSGYGRRWLSYGTTWERDTLSAPLDEVVVRLPRSMDGSNSTPFVVRVPVPVRIGSAQVTASSSTIPLAVRPLPLDAASTTDWQWQLALRPSCRGPGEIALQIMAAGPYPTDVSIARSLLPRLSDSTQACFLNNIVYQPSGAPFKVEVSAFALVEWKVRLP